MKKLFLLVALLLLVITPVYALTYENVSVINNSDSYKGGSPKIEGNGTKNVTVLYDATKLKIVPKDVDLGRTIDAAWVGVKVVAPKDVQIDKLKEATYISGGKENSFWADQDSNKSEQIEDEHYINVFGAITEEHLTKATKAGTMIKYTWSFDWDNDDNIDQTVTILINPETAVLTAQDSNNELWNKDKFEDLKPVVESPATNDYLTAFTGLLFLSLIPGIYAIKKITE